ncbi:glycoside hydrolase family 66 protein [Cytobacillus sp. SAFR-174]|uniref:glycoside hydrolase family 66 protein n=1 Tax=Cytobacillus sp. SAFR-174 TaxID=3436868 RepID=UPI003F7D36DF
MSKIKWAVLLILIMLTAASVFIYLESADTDKTRTSINTAPGNLFSSLHTDQTRYNPGDEVRFTLKIQQSNGKLKVSYFHLDEKIGEEEISAAKTGELSWSWQPPDEDYKGYLAEVEMVKEDYKQSETIAVDVSSDWSKFPRYGFLSDFGEIPIEEMEDVISRLNRYHINGLQFYDWHYEHQEPLKMENGSPAGHWQDVANREVSFNTIKQYIDLAHQKNMKAMSYNLLYGSFENRGLPQEWLLFKDPNQTLIDAHPLPDDWKSNIMIMNPTNPWWQDYIIEKHHNVYEHLPFDGWHIDQLGNRGEVYNEWGDPISISDSFQPFLEKIKQQLPEKTAVVNAVNQYGQSSIASASPAFLYTEVWDEYKYYADLKKILDENASLSSRFQSSVLAAYMNYDHSNQTGEFNEAGILLTNSVIFANGGAHLELGEHMLSKEYFPHNQLSLSGNLKRKLIRYYDFLTAYENLLRDHVSSSSIDITSLDEMPLSKDEPKQGQVWVLAKQAENRKVVHFINFLEATSMEWRDTNASQPLPSKRSSLRFQIKNERNIVKLWFTTPDYPSIKPISIPFKRAGDTITFTLPSLTYWDMLVIEYK